MFVFGWLVITWKHQNNDIFMKSEIINLSQSGPQSTSFVKVSDNNEIANKNE